jgi:hypothetical protein|tara:strand:- start:2998 stop:3267 length:270 start_codon:yes stop_codon:yes gene_type:complete
MKKPKKASKEHLEEILHLLANKLNKNEYAMVTSAMSMMFVGHTFDMSEDGFELINLCIKAKKEAHINRVYNFIEKPRQASIVLLKPKKR